MLGKKLDLHIFFRATCPFFSEMPLFAVGQFVAKMRSGGVTELGRPGHINTSVLNAMNK